jgi:hypothetical protein
MAMGFSLAGYLPYDDECSNSKKSEFFKKVLAGEDTDADDEPDSETEEDLISQGHPIEWLNAEGNPGFKGFNAHPYSILPSDKSSPPPKI